MRDANMNIILLTVFLFLGVPLSDGFEKHWAWSERWSNPENWQPPQVPCSKDTIVINNGAIYVEKNVSVSAITFGENSEIVFDDNTELSLGDQNDNEVTENAACTNSQSEELIFKGQPIREWLDPANWRFKDTHMYEAAPYIERVPCRTDHVIFPKSNLFKVKISSEISVQAMTLNQQLVQDNVLQSYLVSNEGKEKFILENGGKLNVNNSNQCGTSGCICGNTQFKQEICSSFGCSEQKCQFRPVRPFEDCCDRCGGLMSFHFLQNFHRDSCTKALYYILGLLSNNIRIYLSNLENRKIEVVITDLAEGGNLAEAYDIVKNFLNHTDKNGICGGEGLVAVLPSKEVISRPPEDDSKGRIIALSIVLPLIVIVIAIVVVVLWRRRSIAEVPPVKFKNEDLYYPGLDAEIRYATTGFNAGSQGIAISNPVYDDLEKGNVTATEELGGADITDNYNIPLDEERPPAYDDVNENEEKKDPFSKEMMGFGNPLYAELEKDNDEKTEEMSDVSSIQSIDIGKLDESIASMKLEINLDHSTESLHETGDIKTKPSKDESKA